MRLPSNTTNAHPAALTARSAGRLRITVAVSRGEVTASRTVVSLSRLWLHAVTSFRLPGVR